MLFPVVENNKHNDHVHHYKGSSWGNSLLLVGNRFISTRTHVVNVGLQYYEFKCRHLKCGFGIRKAIWKPPLNDQNLCRGQLWAVAAAGSVPCVP